MPKVFVPHMVTKYNPSRGKVVPALNFTDALRFGDLMFVLDESEYRPEFFADTVKRIKSSLAEFQSDDYLIPTGDPALIAICAAEIVRRHGKINILRWERHHMQYFSTTTEFGHD